MSAAWSIHPLICRPRWLYKRHLQYDADRDGRLSFAEFQPFAQHVSHPFHLSLYALLT